MDVSVCVGEGGGKVLSEVGSGCLLWIGDTFAATSTNTFRLSAFVAIKDVA
ncbi:hypothetical protein KDA_65840 [Dictyobacter alpinus]|uniref:Uncharacterized protein n=1 Tax=Dictyobacter alpinus TaxID=2014873 RepID=A0A402BID6_9CHLR|nr:hypothetical protein KDA_65840 [Dictyobacter alpinus]